MYVWVFPGGVTAWMAYLLFVTHGWQRLVTAVLLVSGVIVLAVLERDRHRHARSPQQAPDQAPDQAPEQEPPQETTRE